MVVGLLGILKAGGAYVPLDSNYPTDRLAYMLTDSAPQLVLTLEELRSVLPTTKATVVALDTKLKEIEAYVEDNLSAVEQGLNVENLVYAIYTSGSTGRPKAIAMPHSSVVNLIEWHRETFSGNEGLRVLQFAPLSFDVAFQEVFTTLCTGGTLITLDEWVRRDPLALIEFLRSRSIQRLFVPPLVLQSLAECVKGSSAAPESLRDVITAGEQLRISPEIVNFFRRLGTCRLHNHYGPTETHVVTALTLPEDPETWPSLPAIGRPISNAQIYILNGRGQPTPIGIAGEIYIGGAGVARGYLRQSGLTSQRFLEDPFGREPSARLYRTGDLGRYGEDGTLEYLGRNDAQVKIRGYRIELGGDRSTPRTAERSQGGSRPGTRGCPGGEALGGLRHPGLQRHNSDCRGTPVELESPVTRIHATECFRGAWNICLSHRMGNSIATRFLHRILRELQACSIGSRRGMLSRCWPESGKMFCTWIVSAARITSSNSGGHSLLAMQAVVRIRSMFLIEMPVRLLFEQPSIKHLASHITRLRQDCLSERLADTGDGIGELLDRVTSMPDNKVQELIRKLELGRSQ